MSLTETIIERIRKEGPVSFRDFMEMSLYYPGAGYYTSEHDRIGKTGDFYTSPHLTNLFGDMIAKQLEEMWQLAGQPAFTIVEYGAGSGALCRDILRVLRHNKVLYNRLEYFIIEKSPAMREKAQKTIPAQVRWRTSLREIGPFTGCVLSNELIDNFSVHRVVMEDELMEVFVDYRNGFTELLRPAATPLKDYLRQLGVDLPRGFRTEINLEAIAWIHEIAEFLEKGFVLTIDYGYPSAGLYDQGHHSGTLACYHQHSVNHRPYDHIGEQDITAHVNFSALREWGKQYGLKYCGFTKQGHFMQGLGLASHLRRLEEEERRGLLSEKEGEFLLLHFLMDMGTRFKILIQQKGMDHPRLSGLRFAQPLD